MQRAVIYCHYAAVFMLVAAVISPPLRHAERYMMKRACRCHAAAADDAARCDTPRH